GSGGRGNGGSSSGGIADPAGLGMRMPRVVKGSGSVLVSPKVVPITYDGDPHRADIEAFAPQFAKSKAWAAQTLEDGVGPLTVGAPLHIASAAPSKITDAELQKILTDNLSGNSPAWGAPDPQTIYAFFFPKGSVVDDGSGVSCDVFDGYHYDVVVGNVDVAY